MCFRRLYPCPRPNKNGLPRSLVASRSKKADRVAQLTTRRLNGLSEGSLHGIWIPSSTCGSRRLRPRCLLNGRPSVERIQDDWYSGWSAPLVVAVDVSRNHRVSVNWTADLRGHGSLRPHAWELLGHRLNSLPTSRLRHRHPCRVVGELTR